MHALPLSFVLSLVLIISVGMAAWLGAWFWECAGPAEVGDLFVLGRGASPLPGLQLPLVYPNPRHLGRFLGCCREHPAFPSAQPGVNDFPRAQTKAN